MRLFQVDSFTDVPFKGNPAGVCITDAFPDAALMQAIAMEMNVSETAFVEVFEGAFRIRYFTPSREVPLCGHATLASAHVLYETGMVGRTQGFVFKAQETDLAISLDEDWIRMNFPVYRISKSEIPFTFADVIGVEPVELYRSDNNWVVAAVKTESEVLTARPDFEGIGRERLGEIVAVTAVSDSPAYDFVVRVFCNPSLGVAEDPVTGAANCVLVPYWHQRLNKTTFRSKQLSRRTGEMRLEMHGDRVDILGQTKTVFEIELKAW